MLLKQGAHLKQGSFEGSFSLPTSLKADWYTSVGKFQVVVTKHAAEGADPDYPNGKISLAIWYDTLNTEFGMYQIYASNLPPKGKSTGQVFFTATGGYPANKSISTFISYQCFVK